MSRLAACRDDAEDAPSMSWEVCSTDLVGGLGEKHNRCLCFQESSASLIVETVRACFHEGWRVLIYQSH